MIEDGLGFSFVPSKPPLERHLGRRAWRELYTDTPQMANTLLAVLRVLIAFGVPRGYIDRNSNDVKPLALVDDERQRPCPKEAFKRCRPPAAYIVVPYSTRKPRREYVATITEWLASLGSPEYAQRFAEKGTDGSAVVGTTLTLQFDARAIAHDCDSTADGDIVMSLS